jgi:hypothetical protein
MIKAMVFSNQMIKPNIIIQLEMITSIVTDDVVNDPDATSMSPFSQHEMLSLGQLTTSNVIIQLSNSIKCYHPAM